MQKITSVPRAVISRVQQRLATEAGAPDPRQRQYVTLAMLSVLIGTTAGWLFDVRMPALIAGLTTVFTLIGAGGQALRSDVHRFAWFTPLLVLIMAGGPLLMTNVPVLVGLVVAAVIFATSMLPALGEHYRVAGQTLAAATLIAATTGVGSGQPPLVLFASAAAGGLFALLLRVIIGINDPTQATRAAVARTLTQPGPGVVELAASAWRADGSSTWLGQVLAGAARFRAARETLLARAQQADRVEAQQLREVVAQADLVAIELAKSVRARACTGLPPGARVVPAQAIPAENELPAAAYNLNKGLDRIRSAVVQRVEAPATPPASGGSWRHAQSAIKAHLSLRSSLFRHALRCTLAVAIGMVIFLLLDDPSASSLLLSLCLVLQPADRDSMSGALERTGGAVLGVVVLAVVITLLPGAFLLVPVIMAAMLMSIERLRSDYQFLLASLLAVTVVDQAMRLDRPLENVAISFAANAAVGAAIALFVGYISYLVLPSSLIPDVKGAVRSTVWSVSELLRSLRAAGRGAELPEALHSAHVLALRRTQDLLGTPALLDESNEEHESENSTRSAAIALDALRQDLATLAFRPESERALAVPALQAVDRLLTSKTETAIPDVSANKAPATELLASSLIENALHARAAIDQTRETERPWKSYTLSFLRPEQLRIK